MLSNLKHCQIIVEKTFDQCIIEYDLCYLMILAFSSQVNNFNQNVKFVKESNSIISMLLIITIIIELAKYPHNAKTLNLVSVVIAAMSFAWASIQFLIAHCN